MSAKFSKSLRSTFRDLQYTKTTPVSVLFVIDDAIWHLGSCGEKFDIVFFYRKGELAILNQSSKNLALFSGFHALDVLFSLLRFVGLEAKILLCSPKGLSESYAEIIDYLIGVGQTSSCYQETLKLT